MLKNKIYNIEQDLDKYAYLSREQLYQECINNKLKATLDNYLELIDDNSDYLLTRNSLKVMKAITKKQKEQDVKDIKESL